MLARYTVLHEIGRGATGAVYAARDRTTGAVVALRRLDPALLQADANLAAGFLERAHAAQRLKHRNIVEVLDAGEVAGTAYVAMEMLEGESLRKILDDGPLPITRAIRIAHDIASGLAYAHLEGVVHGGLSASNIVVQRSDAVKIAGFDVGQAEPTDYRSDLLALGAVFYEMLTQRRPAEHPPAPSELNPNVPRAVDAMVLNLLADRMAGAPILLGELQRLEEGLGLVSEAKPVAEEPKVRVRSEPQLGTIDPRVLEHRRQMMERETQRRSSESRSAIFVALGVVLLALGIGFGAFVYYSRPTAPPPVAEAPKQPAPTPVAPQASPPPPPPAPIAAEPVPLPPLAEREVEQAPVAPAQKPQPVPQPTAKVQPAPQPTAKVQPAPQPVAKAPEPQPAGTAQLIVAVSPAGELYIDGEHQGTTTPPTTTFDLEPGMHRIEVRSGSRRPYLTYMTVEAGDVRRIRHDFNAKPLRPPS